MEIPVRKFLVVLFAFAALVIVEGKGRAQESPDIYKAAMNASAALPASLADEPLTFEIWQTPSMEETYNGFFPVVRGRIIGKTRNGDAVLIEFSRERQILKSYRVSLRGSGEGWCEDFETSVVDDEAQFIRSDGELTVTFKFYDDQEESTRELGVRRIRIVKIAHHLGSGRHTWRYGIRYEDLLGSAYVNMYRESEYGHIVPWFFLWSRRDEGNISDVSYRIEVEGRRLTLPENFEGSWGDVTRLEQTEERWVSNDRQDNRYNFYKFRFTPSLYCGPKRDDITENFIAMIDHPGQWVIKIKSGGVLIRELRFRVGADGFIAPHSEQDGSKPGFMNLGPLRVFCESSFGNPDDWDAAFDPAAVRQAVLFGRPWISEEVKTGMLANLPPEKRAGRSFPAAARLP
jgi:hypothetical protein